MLASTSGAPAIIIRLTGPFLRLTGLYFWHTGHRNSAYWPFLWHAGLYFWRTGHHNSAHWLFFAAHRPTSGAPAIIIRLTGPFLRLTGLYFWRTSLISCGPPAIAKRLQRSPSYMCFSSEQFLLRSLTALK
jgi:hypothetical protein